MSRQRILKTLNHQESDRVPLDIGAAESCGITIGAYKNLLNYLELQETEIEFASFAGRTVKVSEQVFEAFDVGIRPIYLNKNPLLDHQLTYDQTGSWFYDEWKIKWRMPAVNGRYYDMVEFPLANKDLDNYSWPDPYHPNQFKGLRAKAEEYINKDKVVVFSYAPGNGFLQMGAQLFGYQDWFTYLGGAKKLVTKFLDRYLQYRMEFWDGLLAACGDKLDIICEKDDLGTQNSTWISKNMYRELIWPYQKKLFSFIKEKADVKIFLHSCGAISDFIPDLIEAGVDILNPVQVNAKNMDSAKLKKEFGKDIVFWGGGIDTQKVLPFGKREDIFSEVAKRVGDLASGGGFVFAAVHNIQDDVPPENILAMVEALHKYGKY